MADAFTGEIRLFPYSKRVPEGWAACEGQTLAIAQYTELYALLKTTWGGDGINNFKLPDLRGRIMMGPGGGAPGSGNVGDLVGSETVRLTAAQLPAHSHAAMATSEGGSQASPAGNVWATASATDKIYSTNPAVPPQPPPPLNRMDLEALRPTGGDQAHDNMQPFLVLRPCICLYGAWPSEQANAEGRA